MYTCICGCCRNVQVSDGFTVIEQLYPFEKNDNSQKYTEGVGPKFEVVYETKADQLPLR